MSHEAVSEMEVGPPVPRRVAARKQEALGECLSAHSYGASELDMLAGRANQCFEGNAQS